MAQSIEEKMLQAIIKDDLKAFDALPEKARCYRLGRFPVLSLLYLYRSRKIISAHEEKLLRITSFEVVREPIEISRKFSAKAGKCLRLYLDEIVTPLEMLLLLDSTRRLKRVYPFTKPSSAVKARLNAIYSIKYARSVEFDGDAIIIERRPLSYREKRNVITAGTCAALAVAAAIVVPITVDSLKVVDGEVTMLSQIDFASGNEYVLKRNITLPEGFSVEAVNCSIVGNGKKLTVSTGASLGTLNGKLSDMKIESAGGALFELVSENGSIENVTVNVNAEIESTVGGAFLAVTNYGRLDGVTVNVKGKISALAGDDEELVFGGIVWNNDYAFNTVTQAECIGVINNCTIDYSHFSLVGEVSADAEFGGVAGINNGYLQNCTVSGEIAADTFDVGGMCVYNYGVLSGNVNNADISQVSTDAGWRPIVGGIAVRNHYIVENCKNGGVVSVASGGVEAYVGGIAALAYGYIYGSVNEGDVSARGNTVYAAGIAAYTQAQVMLCHSSGDISVTTKNGCAGGIFGYGESFYATADYCVSENKITVTAAEEGLIYVGGIAGFIREEVDNNGVYFGGGVTYSYFIGGYQSTVGYFGNIVGVCGANIYASNSYTSGETEYVNFFGNYYIDEAFTAFGATVSGSGLSKAGDKGADRATLKEIKDSEMYKTILAELGK